MDLKLKGKTAVVTGGTAGIGRGIAVELAREGIHVVVPGRSREKLDTALRAIGGSTRGVIADLARRPVRRAFWPLFPRLTSSSTTSASTSPSLLRRLPTTTGSGSSRRTS